MAMKMDWNERLAGPDYVFGTAPSDFITRTAHLLSPGARVLAVADGEGRNGVWLAQQGFAVTSVDVSSNALDKARALARARNVALTFSEADITTWDWPEQAYDAVVAIFIQFCGPEIRARILAGLARALAPGGLLLLHGYRPEQARFKTGGPSRIENLYTRALLEETFADFASLDIREHDTVIAEGTEHVGLSALIDLVGRK
jgi:SAM-dependent methyltransferase